ncbi:hypothetical protein DJ527_01220 [Sulfolobus sp. F1]|nr:hypothetical protein DJ527_01220 [Sulfolobus sp. F1]
MDTPEIKGLREIRRSSAYYIIYVILMMAIGKLLSDGTYGLLRSLFASYLIAIEIILAGLFGLSFRSSMQSFEKRSVRESLFQLIILLAGNLAYFSVIGLGISSFPNYFNNFVLTNTTFTFIFIIGGLLLFVSLLLIGIEISRVGSEYSNLLIEIGAPLILAAVIPAVSFLFGFSELTIALTAVGIAGSVLISVGAYQVQKVLERKQTGE